ncbi:hypothetical protein [Streptomyces silaceus]|uniref:hypothetical protein n=1 Tax=Streptomyces silaceus TaxID=545123 RepID=UPI0012FF0096|nr:hypothetical protein [Streptomyces silaceus]
MRTKIDAPRGRAADALWGRVDATALAACSVASLTHGLTQLPPTQRALGRYDDVTTTGAAWLSGLAAHGTCPRASAPAARGGCA